MIRKLWVLVLAMLATNAAVAGDLVVYSSAPGSLAKQLAAGYEKQSGQHVDLFVSSTGKIMARLAAEASHPHADVVILADWTAGLAMAQQGMVQPYRPAALVSQLRPKLDAAGPFLPIGGDVVSLVANTSATGAQALPQDWPDLATPAWRGKLTMPDPTLSGTASDFVMAFVAAHGDQAWAWFKALKDNGCLWPGPNAAALRPVEMGTRSLMVAGVGHTAIKAKQAGNTLQLILPRSGVLLIPRPLIVMKSSAQQAAAERFVDYAMSPVGQAAVAKSLLLPAVRSVAPSPAWPDIDRATLLSVDWSTLAARRKAVLDRFSHDILGR